MKKKIGDQIAPSPEISLSRFLDMSFSPNKKAPPNGRAPIERKNLYSSAVEFVFVYFTQA